MMSPLDDTSRVSSIPELMDLIRHSFRPSDFLRIESSLRTLLRRPPPGQDEDPAVWRRKEDLYRSRIRDLSDELRRVQADWDRHVALRADLAEREERDRRLIAELEAELDLKREAYEEILEIRARLSDLEASRREEAREREELRERCNDLSAENARLKEERARSTGELAEEVKEKEERHRRCVELEEAYADLKRTMETKVEELLDEIRGKKEAFLDLEHAKVAAEGEVKEWKRKCGELEAKMLRMLAGSIARKDIVRGDNEIDAEEAGVEETSHRKVVVASVATKILPKKKEICFEEEVELVGCCTSAGLGGDIIEISDTENAEKEVVRKGLGHEGRRKVNQSGDAGTGSNPMNINVDRPCVWNMRKDETSEEDLLKIPTPKRRRLLKLSVSESKNEEEDNIPIALLKAKRTNEVSAAGGREKIGVVEASSTGFPSCTVVHGSARRSNRRLVSASRSREVNGKSKETPTGLNIRDQSLANDKTEDVRPINFRTDVDDGSKVCGEVSCHDVIISSTKAVSESEGESLGGFIIDTSDISEIKFLTPSPSASEKSERSCSSNVSSRRAGVAHTTLEEDCDEADSGLAFGKVLARIRRKNKLSIWEYEADMLTSFSKDHDLCLKAVCALYRQQTIEEQSVRGSLGANQRGFNKSDAYRGSRIARFLLDRNPKNPILKSIKDLENYDPGGLDFCHKLASHYSKQLFGIYQNKEDPYFFPP